jgi:hypothetical protein
MTRSEVFINGLKCYQKQLELEDQNREKQAAIVITEAEGE